MTPGFPLSSPLFRENSNLVFLAVHFYNGITLSRKLSQIGGKFDFG